MNARVCLLALVTAAFMAIWNADRPSSVAVVQSQSSHNTVAVSPAATHDTLIPLPKYLQPGTWQAMSRKGDMFRIKIERNESSSGFMYTDALRSEDHGEKLCVINAPDGTRWCFIKEHTNSAQQPGSVQR